MQETNLARLVRENVVDPNAANNLEQTVIDKINAMPAASIQVLIDFKKNVSGSMPWTPARDGAIF